MTMHPVVRAACRRGYLSTRLGAGNDYRLWEFIRRDDMGRFWFRHHRSDLWMVMPEKPPGTGQSNIIPFPGIDKTEGRKR